MDEYSCKAELLKISRKQHLKKEDALIVYEMLAHYHGNWKRSQVFKDTELALSPRFHELLEFFDLNDGVFFAAAYFLFAYSLTDNYRDCQVRIEAEIASPYRRWVSKRWSDSMALVKSIEVGDEFVFLCRHAKTQGMYAPGKSTFTFLRALLESDESVTLVVLGDIDEAFKNLAKRYAKFTLARLTLSKTTDQLISVCSLLAQLKPKVILTEIEFDLPSIIAILGPSMPVILLSPGYYNLPWYDKIGLTDTIADDPVGNRKGDFFVIPTYVASELLDPGVDQLKVQQARDILGIKQDDIVVGSFARMEKFSAPFVRVLKRVLDRSIRAKVLVAGPHDSSAVRLGLEAHLKTQKAIVCGVSDVNILGHCVDIAIDTFPLHSGFSMLELMEKGVPVVAKNDQGIDGYWKQRLPDLVRTSEDELITLICKLVECDETRLHFKQETRAFMERQNGDALFLSELHKAIAS